MRMWLYVRLAIVLLGIVAGFIGPLGPAAKPPMGWSTMLIIFSFLSFGLVLIFAIQAVNPWSAKVWTRPSWTANPFSFKQPLQCFHLVAFATLAQGVGVITHLLVVQFPFYVEAVLPIVAGSGILLGLQFTMLVFRSKIEPVI